MRILKFFTVITIAVFTISAAAQTNPTLTKGKATSLNSLQKVDCSQKQSSKTVTVGNSNRTAEFIISSTITPEGEMNTVEVFNRLSLSYYKTGAANTMLQVFVGSQIQFTGQVMAGNKRSNINLTNVKGKVIKVKITNLSPVIENKSATFEIDLNGLTSSLFKRGYTTLEKGQQRTYTAVTTEKLCTNGARIILTAQTTAGTATTAFAKVVIKLDNSSGTVLATENLLLNTTTKEIYIPSFCFQHKIFISIEYLNNKIRPNFKYKIEGFAVVPLGESPPTAPQTPM